MKKTLFIFVFLFVAFATVEAETNVQFPIKELGNCASEEACRSYCDISANIERCLNFAEKNNLMSSEEISEARKFAAIGKGPGGCTSEKSCEDYCNNATNIRECVTFAEKNGLMSGEELKEAKQILRALDAGAKLPGGCTNEKSCDAYCSNEANILECVTFAEAAGFITAEEASMVKKTGGKGPGGCRGRECETFCQNPDNQEECYNFAKEYGLMSEEMEKGSQDFMDSLKNAPQEVKTCMESAFGNSSKIFPGPKTGAKLRECYEAYGRANPGKAYWPAQEGQEPRREGPGGCKSREECDAYCIANPEACRPEGFNPPSEGFNRPPGGQGEGFTAPPEGFDRPLEGQREGFNPPSEGFDRPPEGMTPPPENMAQPQTETPPSSEPATEPTSRININQLMSNVLAGFSSLLR